MLIYRIKEGIFLPSSGRYLVAMKFLESGWSRMPFMPIYAIYRNEEGPLLNTILDQYYTAMRREVLLAYHDCMKHFRSKNLQMNRI